MTAVSKFIELSSGQSGSVPEESLAAAIRELQNAPALATQLLDAAPSQLLIVDRALTIRWMNGTFTTARNLVPATVIDVPLSKYFGDLIAESAHCKRALAGESVQLAVRTTNLPDDSVREMNVHLRPIQDAGRVMGLCVSVSDPATQAADARGLLYTVPALRQLLGSLPSYVLILDRDMRVLFANRSVGPQTVEQLEGLHITGAFPTKLHPVVLTTLHRVLGTGQLDGFAAELDATGTQPRHFDISVSPVRQDGRIVALTLIATETTEQIRAERAIAIQARMIESMLEGVAVINEAGVIEITNPAFDRLFGYGRGELIGWEMAKLAGGTFAQRERWQARSSSTSMTLEFDAHRHDGSLFAAAGVLAKFEVGGRNQNLLVLQDVSERKQLERAILQAVNREQYRIGNDLHDGLGQELTGIALMLRGVAGRLTSEYPAILPEVEGITRLVSNAIENTRALARGLSPVNLERGGLKDALEGLSMHANDLYGVQVVFSHRLQASARPLGAELANHLYRIAQEAVRNAAKHGKARTIRLHLTTARAKVSLAITDDGIGLPEQAMDATGMGLRIMRYRARMLGGEVQFERVEPTGTRVICECPIELGSTDGRPKASRRAPRAARKTAPK